MKPNVHISMGGVVFTITLPLGSALVKSGSYRHAHAMYEAIIQRSGQCLVRWDSRTLVLEPDDLLQLASTPTGRWKPLAGMELVSLVEAYVGYFIPEIVPDWLS